MPDLPAVELTDRQSAAVATHPRVTLDQIKDKIAATYFLQGAANIAKDGPAHPSLDVLTICVVVMRNGFTVIGKTAPASPANFNVALGRQFAEEDAIRQIWALEGYLLREQLMD